MIINNIDQIKTIDVNSSGLGKIFINNRINKNCIILSYSLKNVEKS